jgi:predicted alpha/beta-hydrolase family hydrolase
VARYRLSATIELHWLTDGNHSFKPPKSSAVSNDDNMTRAFDVTATFVKQLP